MEGNSRSRAKSRKKPDLSIMPEERAEVIRYLKQMKFRRKTIGGVDEIDVWKKIQELDALYAKALEAERVRYDTLLKQFIPDFTENESLPGKGGGEQR